MTTHTGAVSPEVATSLWFNSGAEHAVEYYCSIVRGSEIHDVTKHGDQVVQVAFRLGDARFTAINGGRDFPFTTAISVVLACETQEEADEYWHRFVGDGGAEGNCGWCTDKYGLSWQIVPKPAMEVLNDPDPAAAKRAVDAMMSMSRLDSVAMRKAAHPEED